MNCSLRWCRWVDVNRLLQSLFRLKKKSSVDFSLDFSFTDNNRPTSCDEISRLCGQSLYACFLIMHHTRQLFHFCTTQILQKSSSTHPFLIENVLSLLKKKALYVSQRIFFLQKHFPIHKAYTCTLSPIYSN